MNEPDSLAQRGDEREVPDCREVPEPEAAVWLSWPATFAQPRPMNGILVAMMVMNCTLASSGRLAM
jgi:hypothetical protein